jgi:hypothetical protein
MIRSIANFNFTNRMHREVSNRVCMVEPQAPNWSSISLYILLPLCIMLLLQVLFSYVIRRVILFYVVGWIFRKRSKARIVQLYNRIILARENDRRLGRSRIKYLVERRRLREKMSKEFVFNLFKTEICFSQWYLDEDNWFRRHLFDRIFATVKCVLCEDKYRSAKMMSCPDCPATYCRACADSINGQCYACQVCIFASQKFHSFQAQYDSLSAHSRTQTEGDHSRAHL